ncbi:MAG: hypothetical protein ACRDYA_18635 [Egibacteraceae bacterium]
MVTHEPAPTSGQRMLRVVQSEPLIVSCAVCGGVTERCHDELPWQVIEHWLATHWQRAGLDDATAVAPRGLTRISPWIRYLGGLG